MESMQIQHKANLDVNTFYNPNTALKSQPGGSLHQCLSHLHWTCEEYCGSAAHLSERLKLEAQPSFGQHA